MATRPWRQRVRAGRVRHTAFRVRRGAIGGRHLVGRGVRSDPVVACGRRHHSGSAPPRRHVGQPPRRVFGAPRVHAPRRLSRPDDGAACGPRGGAGRPEHRAPLGERRRRSLGWRGPSAPSNGAPHVPDHSSSSLAALAQEVAYAGTRRRGIGHDDDDWSRGDIGGRSEEHTSELQSPYDLVCRLLLEKKKKKEITFYLFLTILIELHSLSSNISAL